MAEVDDDAHDGGGEAAAAAGSQGAADAASAMPPEGNDDAPASEQDVLGYLAADANWWGPHACMHSVWLRQGPPKGPQRSPYLLAPEHALPHGLWTACLQVQVPG